MKTVMIEADPVADEMTRTHRQCRRDRYFMRMAQRVAEASRCVRATYGTVIVAVNGHVVSTGYNGHPAGSTNDDFCFRVGLAASARTFGLCCIHSEVNAIMYCNPTDRVGATLYVSGVPCRDCALMIMASGIRRLVYLNEGMHVDPTLEDHWVAYGFDQRIQRVAMTSADLT